MMMLAIGAKIISRQKLVAIYPIRAYKNDPHKLLLDEYIIPLIRTHQLFHICGLN